MPFSQYEQLPPRVEAVQFDGSNDQEILDLFENTGTRGSDDDGREYLDTFQSTWMGDRPTRLYVGDFVVQTGSGLLVQPGEAFSAAYRKIT